MRLASITILAKLVFILSFGTIISDQLYIMDPRYDFRHYYGSIEKMTVTLKPQGTYIEAGLYITFSAAGSGIDWNEEDSLEVIMDFSMPEQSFINDMWLYMEDGRIIRAELMDRWTAGFIYESIVKRRIDPSILYKEENNKYKIQVFPMKGNSSRSVKINCFIPCDWHDGRLLSYLPIDMINMSKVKPDSIDIIVYADNEFIKPVIRGDDSIGLTPTDTTVNGITFTGKIVDSLYREKYYIEFSHDFSEGFFANFYKSENKNFYQVLVDLKKSTDIDKPVNIAFLLDYNNQKTNVKLEQVIDDLEKAVLWLTPTDSFNIFISDSVVRRMSNYWIPADTANIESVFERLKIRKEANGSLLPDLLETGTGWVSNNSDKASVILVACSDEHGEQDVANEIGSNILELIHDGITLNVCSFVQKNWITNRIAGIPYTGNDYLYATLTRLTKGVFKKIQGSGNNMYNLLYNSLYSIVGGYDDMWIHTSFTDGYSYDKVQFDNSDKNSKNKQVYIEYGKFFGGLPVKVEFSGHYRKIPFYRKFEFGLSDLNSYYDDRTLWAGTSLHDLERSRSNESLKIYDIINKSLDYNVLSVYTAFLAVEKDDNDTINTKKEEDNNIPVELVAFRGLAREEGIDLYWETASEINNHGFYVERKIFGENYDWESVDFIKGHGNSDIPRYYNYFDNGLTSNTVYQYRLRQVDLDGTKASGAFSNTITIQYGSKLKIETLSCYPNPFDKNTFIRFSLPEEVKVRIEVCDIKGNVLVVLIDDILKAQIHEFMWDGRDKNGCLLPNGIYFCRLRTNDNLFTGKIIINR